MRTLSYRLAIIALSAFVLMTAGCRGQEESSDYPVIDIRFSGEGINTPVKVSTFIDSVQRLHIQDGIHLERPVRIKYVNNHYYIVDRKDHSLLILDDDAGFVGRISRQGRASGEYLALTDFDVNPSNGEISIFDVGGHKMLVFTEDGELVRSFDLDKSLWVYRGFSVLEDGSYLAYVPDANTFPELDLKRGLWKVGPTGEIGKNLLSLDDEYRYVHIRQNGYFSRLGDGSFSLIGDEDRDCIFHITPDGDDVKIAYKLDFEKHMANDVLKSEPSPALGAVYEYRKYWFAETDRWLFVSCTQHNPSGSAFVLYDKAEEKEYLCINPRDMIDDIAAPVFEASPAGDRLVTLSYDPEGNGINPDIVVAFLKQ